MKIRDDINTMNNIIPLTHIIDYTTLRMVIRENDDIFGAISLFLDVIELIQKKPVCRQWKSYAK